MVFGAIGGDMNFWRRDFRAKPEKTRADVIIQKKRRKQDPAARGLKAVAIPRVGARSIHQRNEDRHFLEGTKAVALIEEQEHEVKLFNVSSNGVMIGFEGLLEIGQQVRVVIDDCTPVTTEVRWLQNGRAGLEFASETVIIAEAGVQDFIIKTIAQERSTASYKPDFRVGAEKRGVEKRHSLVWVGKLCQGKHETTVRLRNISASGAMLSMSAPTSLTKGAEVLLKLEGADSAAGRISWIFDSQIGVEFHERFEVSALIAISCAELAPDETSDESNDCDDSDRAVCSDDDAGEEADDFEADDDDFNSLRVRLANKGGDDRKPVSVYSRLSLDEVYDTLHPKAESEGETNSDKPTD